MGIEKMRKGALLLALIMVAAAPTAALAAKKKAPAKPMMYSTTPANSNEMSMKFVRSGLMQPMMAWQSHQNMMMGRKM